MDMKLSWGEVGTVVLSGILIVFAVLVILIAVVWIYGQIFHTINKSKNNKVSGNSTKAVSNTDSITPSADTITDNIAPESADGIPGSVIAAISAAVAAFTGGKGVVTGITRKKAKGDTRRRNTDWGRAGTIAAMKTLNRIGR
jgi:Na+-transporting methylmalonyl-CoA/oxaloacetate decarboxylase gamma subunit